MEANKKLVTYSALAIIAQQDIQQIQQLRQKYDPAFQRWQPHINICFPFVSPQQFENTHKILSQEFNNFKSFQITFRTMQFFPHGTLFLVPQTQDKNILGQIYKKVSSVLPECKGNKDFHPHMTVGKFSKQLVFQKRNQLTNNWKQWTIKCRGLHMIQRGKDTPFKTTKIVEFDN